MVTRTAVIGLGALLAAAACGATADQVAEPTAASTSAGAAAPLTSIPLCEPLSVRSPQTVDDEFWERQNTAIEAIERAEVAHSSDPLWSTAGYDPRDHVIEIRLVQRDVALEESIVEIVGSDAPVRFLVGGFNQQELQAAADVVLSAVSGREDHNVDGVGIGNARGLVEIVVNDPGIMATFADDYDIPGPYDVYCISS